MHSAFLYHAIKAGMDMAIVNPSMLQIYDDIEPELLKCVEDVIFDTDPKATERLIDKATRMKETVAAKTETAHGHHCSCGCRHEHAETVSSRLKTALIKGRTDSLQHDLVEAMAEYGSAVQIIEGPLMEGMENVGKLFGEGKMFLPQVVKSAKVMRDAVEILHPYMNASEEEVRTSKPRIVVATVKGDVHDIGKNIMGIVLTCNGFEVHDLGVMVDKETILEKAIGLNADIIAVSGLITPSLFQMEELCREMSARGMSTPLFIGGATTNALHTAVRLAPLYGHVFHGPDASATAVMANKCMTDRKAFEQEQHNEQERIRALYAKGSEKAAEEVRDPKQIAPAPSVPHPQDIPAKDLRLEDVLPYFDWRMFYAIWGVKYGSASPEAMELMQLRQDAEEELALGNFLIRISARFLDAWTDGNDIICTSSNASTVRLPMLRQEKGECMSLCDFIADEDSGSKSPLGFFTISVKARKAAHEEGCCCPACGNKYEDLVAKTVRMTLAEAASKWLDKELETFAKDEMKFIKPAAGYASCPDHTLKRDIMDMLSGEFSLGIKLTESCAMIPEASICGMIVMHPQAKYIEVRKIGQKQHDEYVARRGMDAVSARRFLGHLLDA
jgi:5-methyltetrahydrofolate--homocysteine methyltransferase